jgi:CelD/BcsL family acetyltransferase involved in cellulose biosynthesis
MDYSIALEDFPSLAEPWEGLLPMCPTNTIFSTPQWVKSWWQEFGGGKELLLLSVRRDGELIGIAPLMRQGESISLIGGSDICDYMDFIASPDQERVCLTLFLDYLESMNWHHIDLQSLLPHSTVLSHLAPLAREKDYSVEITKEDVSPQVILPQSWEDYLSRLKGKERHELRRKLRRLSQVKSARYYTVEDRDLLSRDLEDFFKLFQQSGPEKMEFMTNQMRGFFKAMARSLAEKGYLRLSFLEVDGIRVAAVICFDYGNELYLYNSGYDPGYAFLSVGLLCKVFCLRECILNGKRRFDLLRGAEAYKYDMGGQDVPIYRCLIYRR